MSMGKINVEKKKKSKVKHQPYFPFKSLMMEAQEAGQGTPV